MIFVSSSMHSWKRFRKRKASPQRDSLASIKLPRMLLTLPRQVHVVRLALPPGRHDLRLELLGADGRVAREVNLDGVVVRPGAWTFASQRIF